MQNVKISFLLLMFALLAATGLSAQDKYHRCSTTEYMAEQIKLDPSIAERMRDIESFTKTYTESYNGASRAVVTIPVVVHVVYNTTAQNISSTLINAQIDQLNKDYAKLNSDASKVPAGFAGAAAATNVQFCLAQRDPNGNATTGIIRKQTTVTSFSTNDAVKYSSKGGDNAWPASSYLNLWVCNLGNQLLGYAQFPGGNAATDGVVVLFSSVGSLSTPGSSAPYNYGRTATHEVGHWLNLYHIWGDDKGACTGSDQVGDTPNQGSENYGCPTYPLADACTSTSPGVMFMNYMDYTDDGCMYMFTTGQASRMNALFATGGARVGLATSLGCVAPSTTCNIPTGMATSNITAASATFGWSAVSGAASYKVQYRIVGAASWTTATSTTNSFNASNLSSSSNYEWQVQTVCTSGSSAFTASTTFNTLSASLCTIPTGLGASSIGNNTATLTWGAVSGALSYNLQWKASTATTWTSVTGLTTTSYALSNLSACTGYQFQVQTVCAAGTGSFSSTYSFTTTGCVVSYCASKGASTYEFINKVVLGTINNTSGNNSGYANYTNLSTSLAGGTSNTITLTAGYVSTSYTEYWKVYIDYNKNGVFTDAGEAVASVSGKGTVSKAFTVPTTALNGSTRMRIQMSYGGYQTNPCANFTYGEVEDYTVTITGNAQRLGGDETATEVTTTPDIHLYPNPAQDHLTVAFSGTTEGKAFVSIYSLTGQRLALHELNTFEGANLNEININQLSNGVYIFEINNNGTIERRKITVTK